MSLYVIILHSSGDPATCKPKDVGVFVNGSSRPCRLNEIVYTFKCQLNM